MWKRQDKEVLELQQDIGKAERMISDFYIQRIQMQKEIILQKLREQGCRITKQRLMILDIILEENCSCCKEIYYKVCAKDEKIGSATVYRMMNILEDIGAISRRNIYKIECDSETEEKNVCTIQFNDNTVIKLSEEICNQVVQKGLEICGYVKEKTVKSVGIEYCK